MQKIPKILESLAKKAREFKDANELINQRLRINNLGETIEMVKRHKFSNITEFYNASIKSEIKGDKKWKN